ncbi:hypothetical protein BH23BAC3_BH23BAC3_11700 [soil metagenome]
MIKLHRLTEDPAADKIEERFKDLVLSYKTVLSTGDSGSDKLPRIEDGDDIISGDEQIEHWLRDLEDELKWQRSLSGDGCYIDPKSGKIC